MGQGALGQSGLHLFHTLGASSPRCSAVSCTMVGTSNSASEASLRSIAAKWFDQRMLGSHFIRHIDGNVENNHVNNLQFVNLETALQHVDDWEVDWSMELSDAEELLVMDKANHSRLLSLFAAKVLVILTDSSGLTFSTPPLLCPRNVNHKPTPFLSSSQSKTSRSSLCPQTASFLVKKGMGSCTRAPSVALSPPPPSSP